MINPRISPIKNLLETLIDRIRGFKYGEKGIISIELNESTSKSEIETLVSKLDHRMTLRFYDAFYGLQKDDKPWPHGDNGAFTDVTMKSGRLVAKRGNHGGYKDGGKWLKISKQELIDTIFKSRDFNFGKIKIESRLIRTQWVKSMNSKVLVAYYHDISEINSQKT
ncbi:hypothetical protein [Roseivirga thermotolerans]|uniref:Uncharacterized protein n=1 Tax=Roseivirga thermotolerans TaxID=1758176 RepID=A0ABQ3I3C9_9BACT|nr:hypothetical protein [Roseivirga thermotolerans]GHE59336.1 hypothetical protein GCM10011340_12460 [Roseivirga thermotolerans]